jgi:hypothetical protein
LPSRPMPNQPNPCRHLPMLTPSTRRWAIPSSAA